MDNIFRRPTHHLPPPAPEQGSAAVFAWAAHEDGWWKGGRAGPVDAHASLSFHPGRCEVPPHQKVLGCTIIAAMLEHQRSGRRGAQDIGGVADLSGLTPPALSAPRPVPPATPALGS